jgi:hypothetical protein
MYIGATTGYPKALANINVGVRLDLANWITPLGEFAVGQFFRIGDNRQQSVDLEVGPGFIETWKRVPRQAAY